MTFDTPTDDELITRARRGEQEAFAALMCRYERQVLRVAFLDTQDAGRAREIAQDVFIKAFRHLDRFRGDAAFGTWLHRITVNQCRDARRALHRLRRHLAIDEAASARAPADLEPERSAMRAEDAHDVRRAIGRLPDELRRPLALRYGAGLRYQQIADVLGLPLGTVCTRLQRAVQLLGRDARLRETRR